MAWGTKYKLEFADFLGTIWTVNIKKAVYTGPVITLIGSGEPVKIEYYGDDDPFSHNVCGSKATLSIIAESDFMLSELFTSNDFEYPVDIYHGESLFWNGYILSNSYQEPYDCAPFAVSLVAVDGLGLLKAIEFKELNLTGRQRISKIIYDILAKIGITSFTEYVNVFEVDMDQTTQDSPFDQSGINCDLFAQMTCYDALTEILKTFNAAIRQDNGIFCIYRIIDQTREILYGRTFTSGFDKSSANRLTTQYISRNDQPSNFRDHEGGTLMITPQIKTLIANQDFGMRESIFTNADFPFAEFVLSDTVWECNGWTRGTLVPIHPLSSVIKGSGDSGILIGKSDTVYGTSYISQDVVFRSESSQMILTVEASGVTLDGAEHSGWIGIQLINTDGVNEKYFDGSGWVSAAEIITLDQGTYTPDLVFNEYTYRLPNSPLKGVLIIKLYAALSSGANVYSVFKSIKLKPIAENGQLIEGIGYTISSNTYGAILEKNFLIGDGYGYNNDPVFYKGAINMFPSDFDFSPSSKIWYSIYDVYPTEKLIELIAGELGEQFSRQKQLIDIPIIETNASSFLTMIGNIQDTKNKVEGVNRKFVVASATYNVKMREWMLGLCEVIIWPKPVVVSVVIESVSPSICIVTFDRALDDLNVPDADNFEVLEQGVVGTGTSVSGVSVSGSIVTLSLAVPAARGLVYQLDYIMPATNYLISVKGAKVATFYDQSITNNV